MTTIMGKESKNSILHGRSFVRNGEENADIKYAAYMEGANETLQTVLDRCRTFTVARAIYLDDIARVIDEMRTGVTNKPLHRKVK